MSNENESSDSNPLLLYGFRRLFFMDITALNAVPHSATILFSVASGLLKILNSAAMILSVFGIVDKLNK